MLKYIKNIFTVNINNDETSLLLSSLLSSSFPFTAFKLTKSFLLATLLGIGIATTVVADENVNHQFQTSASNNQQLADSSAGLLKVGYISANNYLIFDGSGSLGFDYQLLSNFAEKYGYAVKFNRYSNYEELYADLKANKLDLAAGHLSVNSKRFNSNNDLIPVEYLKEELVLTGSKYAIKSLDDKSKIVFNNKVYVPNNFDLINKVTLIKYLNLDNSTSSSYKLARQVNEGQIEYALMPANTAKAMKQLLSNFDYIELDDLKLKKLTRNQVEDQQEVNTKLLKELAKDDKLDHANGNLNLYYIASNKVELAKDLTSFIEQLKFNKGFSNIEYSALNNLKSLKIEEVNYFSKMMKTKFLEYSPVFKKYSKDIDYRLSMAVGYQESRWNPRAKAINGPSGLMMLTNASAKDLGVTNKLDAEQSIEAGVKILQTF